MEKRDEFRVRMLRHLEQADIPLVDGLWTPTDDEKLGLYHLCCDGLASIKVDVNYKTREVEGDPVLTVTVAGRRWLEEWDDARAEA
jgi:hypothetical protein